MDTVSLNGKMVHFIEAIIIKDKDKEMDNFIIQKMEL